MMRIQKGEALGLGEGLSSSHRGVGFLAYHEWAMFCAEGMDIPRVMHVLMVGFQSLPGLLRGGKP